MKFLAHTPTRASTPTATVPKHSNQYTRSFMRFASGKQGYYGENANEPDWRGATLEASEPVVPQVSYYDGEDSFSANRSSQSVYLNDSFYRSEMEGLARAAGSKAGRAVERSQEDSPSRSKRLVRKAVGAFEQVVKTNAKLKYRVDIDGELVRMVLGKGLPDEEPSQLVQRGATHETYRSALEQVSRYNGNE